MAEFDVRCNDCNTILDASFSTYNSVLEVVPCQKCMDEANDKGYDSGLKETEN